MPKRRSVSQEPRITPCASMHPVAYREHEGSNRQDRGSSGERSRRYSSRQKRATRLSTSFVLRPVGETDKGRQRKSV